MKLTCVTPKQAKADAVVVGVISKDDKRTAPGLARMGIKNGAAEWLINNETTGLGLKAVKSVPTDDFALVLVGLGDPEKLTQEKLGAAMNAALKHVKDLGFRTVSTSLHIDATSKALDEQTAIQALVTGAVVGDLSFDQWHKKQTGKAAKKPRPGIDSVQFVDAKPASIRKVANAAAVIAEAVNDARLLANTPANVATPKWMAAEAKKRGTKHGFKVTVKGRAQLRKEKYGALCGVAQGSVNEEQLVIMDYNPPGAKKTIVVVGKGVTFDSGGISLKPGNGMWDMKYDKCGACNTIALMTTLKDLGVKHRVIGITPCVENMPSGNAQRPGDIITAKDGTTIEVLNTDAEGRLILADAITLGTTYKPDWMVDMATLTGACDVAVGGTHVAVLSKDDDFAQSLIQASRKAGDKAWHLPQGEEFDEANKGTYADLQNISLTNKAGTCIGGSFVGHFAKDVKFGHLDIASKAWTTGMDYFPKGPTGAGLRIVVQRILDE